MNSSDEEFQEDITAEEEAEQGPALIKRLRERLKKAVEEKQEYLNGWQRARADFANFKKEEAAREQEKEERATLKILEQFMPALDALEMSVRGAALEQAPPQWAKGMKAVYNEFSKALERLGIEKIYPMGEKVDHHTQEILRELQIGDKQADQTIVEVHRSGYKIGERVVRPAQVSVGVFRQ